MKYYSIRSRDDALSYYAYAPSPEAAIKVVEALMGPMNPAQRVVREIHGCPVGLKHPEFPIDPNKAVLLDPADEDEE